ncbi:hypothetical protein IQ07DRAFT_584998, partial [Pyrenochaeta sp. DS3sAY3a]
MPPANSPDPEPPSFISALRDLESPVNQDVLNLAATLSTHTDDDDDHLDDHHHDNDHNHDEDPYDSLPYLEAALERDQRRLERSRERLRLLESQRDALDQRDRLRRVMSRLSRLSDSSSPYGDRVPSQNSLYDWSPANEADDEDELDQILAELRREQPNTHPEILRVLGQSQLHSERARIRSISNRLQNIQPSGPGPSEHSLRSTAILQNVRRHPRFSARTREYLQRYQSESDIANRWSSRSDSRERYLSQSASRQQNMQRQTEGRTALDRERRDMLSRADTYRRNYLDRATNSSSTVSPMLEQTVKYLSQIRHSNTIDDSLDYALDAGFLKKDQFCSQYADFVTGTSSIPPPSETSWLSPGAVLSGCQHATNVTSTITTTAPTGTTTMHRFRIIDGSGPTGTPTLPPPHPWISNNYSSTRTSGSPVESPQQDRWPVKVTIHAVDWDKMSLSATMEAYNVPSHPHTHQSILGSSLDEMSSQQHYTRTSSITTYLEGEILDFNNYTLLTESFKSSPTNDATYWRKLPPFQKMSDEEVVAALTSRKWLTEVLSKEWILMRWKERCFVKSLNRSTSDPTQTSSFTSGSAQTSFQPPSTYTSQLQASPYRIVRNQQTGRAEVEISPMLNSLSSDAEQATFDDSGCGLTISGFYYVCLRRSDGKLEGLYYDPQSSPYQCLKLDSVKTGVFPAWGF